jgi:toxin-antitoxin system PIN domain toxin
VVVPDVYVLVYAHRVESPDHAGYAGFLARLARGPEPFGFSDAVGAAFVRIVTHHRLWRDPTPPETALDFVARLRARRACRLIAAGPGAWPIFARFVAATSARGKLVADAWLAAQTTEHACTLATCDGDFARFPGLRWQHPLGAKR